MAGLRAVLDANVLLSGLTFPANAPGKIVALWHEGGLNVVLSRYILNEVARVLPRMSRVAISQEEARNLADRLATLAEMVEPDTFIEPTLRDFADQPVLATLRVSKADYLITGDKDLLALAHTYPILSPAEFWQRHG
jgi:putative PIN family toxin of toxin-antitoxin system